MGWPVSKDPKTEFVTVRFTVSEAKDLDDLVAVLGVASRSAALRNAVGRVVAAEKKRRAQTRS